MKKKPRTPSFGREQRSRLAKRAATARWTRLGRGVLTLAEIRAAVVKALAERETKIAPGGAGIPPGLPLLPEPPAPAGSEAESPGKRKRKPKAYLFGSYARGDAHARSDLDILVITEKPPEDLLGEIADLSSAMHDALGDDVHKSIDLLVVDEKTYEEHKSKNWDGSVYHEAYKEGIRLA